MFIEEFLWLPDIVEKLISKHRVTPDEVEDVFFNRPRFRFHEKGMCKARICTRLPDKLMVEDI